MFSLCLCNNSLVFVNMEQKIEIIVNGKQYKIGDGKWLPLTKYAAKYGHTSNKVWQWIARGVIPKVNFIKVEKNIYIKDLPYTARRYKQLTVKEIREIKRLYSQGERVQFIADQYNASVVNIMRVVKET